MKRGQVTLFIIMGILIVSVIFIFFLWVKPTYIDGRAQRLGFEGCVQDALEQSIDELGTKGGFVDPRFAYPYFGERIPYLCYTSKFYETCTIQKPFLKQHFEEGISKDIKASIDNCYSNSVTDLRSQGYGVVSGEVDYEVSLEPGIARIKIDAPTTVGSSKFARFNVKLNSQIYEILMISTSILQYEASFGDSDVMGLMINYPDFIIDKLKQSDGTTIYIVESKSDGTKFKFASRSLAWPAGYDT